LRYFSEVDRDGLSVVYLDPQGHHYGTQGYQDILAAALKVRGVAAAEFVSRDGRFRRLLVRKSTAKSWINFRPEVIKAISRVCEAYGDTCSRWYEWGSEETRARSMAGVRKANKAKKQKGGAGRKRSR
jgi:hypothetical protein